MKTVTIHFTGGAPYSCTLPREVVEGVLEALAAPGGDKLTITNSDGYSAIINRAQITFVEVA